MGGFIMRASTKGDLSSRLDAVIGEARGRVKAFQSEAEKAHREVRERFQKFVPIAERITAMAREKLERLRERLKFDFAPAHAQTDRYYVRSVRIDVESELAGVIKLSFKLTHDRDVSHILLDYDLEIIPVFFRFEPHARLEIPLEAYDEAAVAGWLDDRLVDFANAYTELHLTKQYQERVLVPDPVAGISFPKYFAASTLDHEGKTYYFISDETRREFEKQHGLTR
jgi:YHS domain-containing protein